MQINVADVVVGEGRLRGVNKVFMPRIQASIVEVGQRQPIVVRALGDKYKLIDGLHRLTVAKTIGWEKVEADVVKFPKNWSEERIELEARKIEVDNNLARANLTQTEQTMFVAEKTRVVMAIQIMDDLTAATEKAEAAKAASRAARAAVKTAPSAKAEANREDAEAEEDSALAKLKRARERTDVISKVGWENAGKIHGMKQVQEKVAAEVGLSPFTLQRFQKFTRWLGSDLLKKIQGSQLDTKEQLEALVSLKKRTDDYAARNWPKDDQEAQIRKGYVGKYADLWKRVLASLDTGRILDAHKEYSELASTEGREVKALLEMFSLRTPETQWKVAAEKLQEAATAIGEVMLMAESKSTISQIKHKQKQLEQAYRIVGALRTWAHEAKGQMKPAKVTGNEGKYVGIDPAQTKAKAQARADQDVNSKKSAKAMKGKK